MERIPVNDRTKIEAGSIGNIFINKRKAACCDPRAGEHMQLFCDLCLQKKCHEEYSSEQ